MSGTPSVCAVGRQAAAVIGLVVPRPDMPRVFGPAVAELTRALHAQGIAPAGPLFAHHLRLDPGVFDFELDLPVDRPPPAARPAA